MCVSSTEMDNKRNTLDVTVDQKKKDIFGREMQERRDGHSRQVIHEERVKAFSEKTEDGS